MTCCSALNQKLIVNASAETPVSSLRQHKLLVYLYSKTLGFMPLTLLLERKLMFFSENLENAYLKLAMKKLSRFCSYSTCIYVIRKIQGVPVTSSTASSRGRYTPIWSHCSVAAPACKTVVSLVGSMTTP